MARSKKPAVKPNRRRTLPGDPGTLPIDRDINAMIRVNHAGEYGARRIYEGQIAALQHLPEIRKAIEKMAEQERAHLEFFENELRRRPETRPSALHPLWHMAGYAAGWITGRMGPKAAMACTVAVEKVISEHYGQQLTVLAHHPDEKKLRQAIARFKAEEEEHHDTGLAHDAEGAPGYQRLCRAIETGTRLAILLAKRF